MINSETAIIDKISAKSVSLKFEDGKTKSIPINNLKHFDLGYCVTVHNSQGKTFDNTIAAISNNKLLNTQKAWLVAISRHKNEFTAIVEDKNLLKTCLMRNDGKELSAIEFCDKAIDSQHSGSNGLKNNSNYGTISKMTEIEQV